MNRSGGPIKPGGAGAAYPALLLTQEKTLALLL
jgi:hypothetical protein